VHARDIVHGHLDHVVMLDPEGQRVLLGLIEHTVPMTDPVADAGQLVVCRE